MADEQDDVARVMGEAIQLFLAEGKESRSQDQIFGRIAGERKLGCDQQRCARGKGAGRRFANASGVSPHIAHDEIDLGDCDAHVLHLSMEPPRDLPVISCRASQLAA